MNACLQTESYRMCQLYVFLAALMIGPSAAAQVSPVPGDAPTLDSSQFHHRFYGAPGASYVVEASSDLTRWTAVATNTVPSSGRLDFADSLAGNFPQRFYRIVPASGPVGVHEAGDNFREDRILVKPRTGILLSDLGTLHAQAGARILKSYTGIGNLQVLEVDGKTGSVSNLIAGYRRSALVEYAE